jgi:hypothetical protein
VKDLLKLTLIIYSLNTFAFIESVDKLVKDGLYVTEKIKEVQVDEFHEDTKTVTYWSNNAQIQRKLKEKSLLHKSPCSNKGMRTNANVAEEKEYKTTLGLLVKYNSEKLTQLDIPLKGTKDVGGYLNRIFNESPLERHETLSHAKVALSFEEKIKLASYIGKRFDANYDFERAKEGSKASKGIITLQQLIDGYNKKKRTGICRDIAVGQVQIMNELGLDCKVTGYTTARATGHATVVCTDPKDPDKTVRINYGEVAATNQSGTTALNQNGSIPGTSVTYRVYNKDGEFVTGLKTDLGKMLSDASGADAKEIDWQERFDSNIAKVNILDVGNVFYGQTTDGHTVIGVASDMEYKKDLDYADLSLKSGGAFAHVKNEFAQDVEQGVFFFRARADLDSKPLKVTEKSQVKAKLGINQTSTLHFGIGDKAEDKTNSNLTLDLVPALEAQAKVTDRTVATIAGGSKFETGLQDVRDPEGGYMLSRSADFIHTSLDHQLTENINAIATATVVNRNQLGQTGQVSIGAKGQSFKSTLVYDSRLDDKTPGFVPGATPTVTFEHQHRVNKNIGVSGGAKKQLAGAEQVSVFLGVEMKY